MRAQRDRAGRLITAVGRQPLRQVIKPETARAIVQMMVGATEGGTGKGARIDGYAVAGKTATAEKPGSTGGYDPGRYMASFLGLVPVPDPRLAILVALDEPRGAYSGGEVAAPVFKQIASQILWYLRIPPSAGRSPASSLTSSPTGSGTR
jgi:cell division protein FtsI/penicillin-binding protein 2